MSEEEIQSGPINYVDVVSELTPLMGLEYKFLRQSSPEKIRSFIDKMNISDASIGARTKYILLSLGGSNELLHMLRLIQRPGAERNFALAYLQGSENFFETHKNDKKRIRKVLFSEGPDTVMFWTFSPYLYEALIQKGLAKDKAFEKVLLWSRDGLSIFDRSKKGEDFDTLKLKGLEHFNDYISEVGPQRIVYKLDRSPSHISHQFTRQEAKRLADILLRDGE